jgi:hypothetical protein
MTHQSKPQFQLHTKPGLQILRTLQRASYQAWDEPSSAIRFSITWYGVLPGPVPEHNRFFLVHGLKARHLYLS